MRRRREDPVGRAVERELGNIVGIHVGEKLKSVHCVRGSSAVRLASGTEFVVGDLGQPVTGQGIPAGTFVASIVAGRTAVLSKAYTMSHTGEPG